MYVGISIIYLYIVYCFFTEVLDESSFIRWKKIDIKVIKENQEYIYLMSVFQTAKNLYPGFQTEKYIQTQYQIKYPLIKHQQSLEGQSFSLADSFTVIKQNYKELNYALVIQIAQRALREYEQIKITDKIMQNAINITYDLSKIRSILAMTYINVYRFQKKKKYIQKALDHLKYEYDQIETIYKRGQRLNNIGLCQMILGRYNNAFKCFCQAFHIYKEEPDLNIFGLIKNISEIYKKLQMFQQAIKYYEFIFTEFDSNSNNHYENYEYTYLIISALECSNFCKTNTYSAIYQRAKQFLPKITNAKKSNYALLANIQLEMLKYAIKYGIKQNTVCSEQIEGLFHEIMHFESQDGRLLYLKGQACYYYSEMFKFNNWDMYRKLMKRAEEFFDSACEKVRLK